MAEGTGAHRAQGRPVLLPAVTDQGHERRLGHVLALHHPEPPAREGPGGRRLHDGVPAKPHQRRQPTRL
ncbi:hypothetical protein G6F46_014743 [Rhizopus delemar]|nr:hypothetical protein G6F24_017845 [Rhizopus arrhizus]KAG1587406.1 hypothetical protein G6F46_014743 [Rhizopus delemar]